MRQGTTPTHTFTLPFDTSTLSAVKITYAQSGEVKLQKKTPDCVLSGNTVTVELTQEDTFLFEADKTVLIQVRVLTLGGDALSSAPVRVSVYVCLDKEVLT